MERLHFVCPHTQQDIDVGIDSELNTLLRIRNKHVLARCPVCGERHEWEVREAKSPPGRLSGPVMVLQLLLLWAVTLLRMPEGGRDFPFARAVCRHRLRSAG